MSPQPFERTKIMDAAYRRLASTKGTSLSVTDLLRAAGLSTRAFYRHFDSKDELLLALVRRDAERVTADSEATATAAVFPRAALAGSIDGMLQIPADPRRRQRVLLLSSEEVTRARGCGAERQRFQAAQ